MDKKTYSDMYEVKYKKPECIYTTITYVGGNDEEEALANAINGAVSHHNKYNDPKIKPIDIQVVGVEKVGEYNKVLRDLQRG